MRLKAAHAKKLVLSEAETAFYTGTSMYPTLKARDCLRVIPYHGKQIRPGDVIVFKTPPNGKQIVHRVISVDAQGRVRTRGDNNPNTDAWILSSDEIQGRVTHALNGVRLRRVPGGTVGILSHVLLKARRALFRPLLGLARGTYRWLARTGLVRKMLRRKMDLKVVAFRCRNGGDELRLLLGSRLIGRLKPGHSEWLIAPPFRLLVDEASLPHSISSEAPGSLSFRSTPPLR